jgi:addiction module HigA family antidote
MPLVGDSLIKARVNVMHPGAIFQRRFLKPKKIPISVAAKIMNVEISLLTEFVHENASVTPPFADQLAAFTETDALFWLNMQEARDRAQP